jgi:uncharacterized membrane protein
MITAIALVVVIVASLTGALLLLPKLARPTLPFGVRVPDSHVDAPVIKQATRQYYRGVVQAMLVVAALLVALAIVAATPAIASIASFAALAAWLVPYLSARRTVLAAKQSEGWYEGVRQTVAVETSLRTSPPPYPWLWAVPAIAVAAATVVIGVLVYPSLPDRIATNIGPDGPESFADTTVWSAFGLVGVQVLVTGLLLGLVVVALRSKHELAATSPQASADQYRRYASAMAKSVLVLAAGMNLTMLMVALIVWEVLPATTAWIILSTVPALATAAVAVGVAIWAGQSGHRLRTTVPAELASANTADRDDDAYWIAGLIYLNRDDPALWVPKRYGGVGWTINLARPAAWVLTGAILALVLGGTIAAVIMSNSAG